MDATASTIFSSSPSSRLYKPIPEDMLEIAPNTMNFSTINLNVNGVNARCGDQKGLACSFEYTDGVTPVITDVVASVGSVTNGDMLVINGKNLQYEGGAATVSFGDAPCTVTQHSATSIQCTISHAEYGYYLPVVNVEHTGLATQPDFDTYKKLYAYSITNVAPLTTGIRGGTVITLSGTGFSLDKNKNNITIGGGGCRVLTASHFEVTCEAPELSMEDPNGLMHGEALQESSADVVVSFFDNTAFAGGKFVYDWALTPSMTYMDPIESSSARTVEMTINLRSEFAFSAAASSSACTPTMTLVSPSGHMRTCENLVLNATTATCTLVRAAPLPVDEQPLLFPRLALCTNAGEAAIAHPEPQYSLFDHALRISKTIPPVGSVAGGTRVTIRGAGFVRDNEKILRSAYTYNYYDSMVVVDINLADRKLSCVVEHSNFKEIICVTTMPTARAAAMTASPPHHYTGGYSGVVDVRINDYAPAGCGNDPHPPMGNNHTYTSNGKWAPFVTQAVSSGNSSSNGFGPKDGAWNWEKDGAWSWEPTKQFTCEFDYAQAATPTIASVSPPVGNGATTLTITGTNFGNSPRVHVGQHLCTLRSFNLTQVTCDAPAMTGGRYVVRVDVPQLGYAAHPVGDAVTFVSKVIFSHVYPRVSSIAGGQLVTIHGYGFSDDIDQNTVTVQGQIVHTIFANHSQIVAVTPKETRTPAIVGKPQDCGVDEKYIQIQFYGNTACQSKDMMCIDADMSAPGHMLMNPCNASNTNQLFRLEPVKRNHERLPNWKLDPVGVFRLHHGANDAMCLQPESSDGCTRYTWVTCSTSASQEIHLSKFFGLHNVFNWGFGGSDKALDSYGTRCEAKNTVWHCDDNQNDAKKWKALVTSKPTGSKTPPCSTSPGNIGITIQSDAQPDYFFGQTKPVYHTSVDKRGKCGDFGGKFELIYRQTAPYVMPLEMWNSWNPEDNTSAQFSLLNQVESYRRIDGSFEFKLVWPNSTSQTSPNAMAGFARTGPATQYWRQTSNPMETHEVTGYEALELNYTANLWSGLAKSARWETLIDGSDESNNWYYAVGMAEQLHVGDDATGRLVGYPGAQMEEEVVELYACKEGHAEVPAHTARDYKIDWGFDTKREGASLTIEKGDQVTWVFDFEETTGSSATHTIVSGTPGRANGIFVSEELPRRGRWSKIFNETGVFEYHSLPFGYLTGAIAVHEKVVERPESYRLWADKHCATPKACTMIYAETSTPTLEHITPKKGRKGDRITITGTGFVSGQTEVKIGSIDCDVDASKTTATSVECAVGETPGGTHNVYVTVSGKGTAEVTAKDRCLSWCSNHKDDTSGMATSWNTRCSFTSRACSACSSCESEETALGDPGMFISELGATSLSVTEGSLNGGTIVEVNGYGFGGGESTKARHRRSFNGAWGGWFIYDTGNKAAEKIHGTKIELCDKTCTVISSTYSQASCVTEPHQTAASMLKYDNVEPKKLIPTQALSSDQPTLSLDPYIKHAKHHCYGTAIHRWNDGEWSEYESYKYTPKMGRGISHCKAICDQHTECSGFTVQLYHYHRCAFWRKGEMSIREHTHWDCYQKRGDVKAMPLFQGSFSTVFRTKTYKDSWVGMDLGQGKQALLTRLRFFPVHQKAQATVGGRFEVSNDLQSWTNVGNITEAHQGWNWINIPTKGQSVHRFVRYVCPTTKEGELIPLSGDNNGKHINLLRCAGDCDHDNDCAAGLKCFQRSGYSHINGCSGAGRDNYDYCYDPQAPAGQAEMTQFEFYGLEAETSGTCNVDIAATTPLSHPSQGVMETDHSEAVSVDTNLTFTYKEENTGVVTKIEPKWGSSLGGQLVTITGTNLATNELFAHVTINDRDCVVKSVASNGKEIQCETTHRDGPGDILPPSIVVTNKASAQGRAISKPDTIYRDLDKWSQVNSWLNDEPPVTGDMVVIKAGQTILMDISPPQLNVLLVEGMLVFDRKDLNLDATYILVYGGTLEIGTEKEPFMQTATITLHGHRRKTIELPFVGSKVLGVADRGGFTSYGQGRGVDVPLTQKGILDIHGKPRLRTWTKVKSPVAQGSQEITTSEKVDFEAGEIIVLTAPHQELTVVTVKDGGYTIVVKEAVAANHASEIRTYKGPKGMETIDMRCEVALISRNIIIQGAGRPRHDGTPTIVPGHYSYDVNGGETSEEQLYGCHTGAFHGGHYRVENAEIRNCGQAGNLGRYSMHLHVTDDNPAPNTYLKANSIHHSFQRATTIHGTHHSLVRDNVAYHVMGHTYFVEDGDETYNTFDNNIGIFTRPSHLALKSDTGPSTFWTAIPTNFWRNNVAVDSSDRGAWFELTTQGITLEFFNNTFHDNTGIGWRNYPNYSPPSPQYFYNNTYFKNGGNGLFYKKGGDNHHVFSKFAENGVDIFWLKYKTHDSSRMIPNVKDCTFWGEKDQNGGGAPAIFGPQAEFWYVDGANFVNYQNTGAISACAGCCSPIKFKQGAYTYRFKNLVWSNSNKRTHWTCPYKQILYDLDGSLTGYKGGTALPYYQFNEWDGECVMDKLGTYSGGKTGMVCNDKVRVRRLQVWGAEPRELDMKAIYMKKSEVAPAGTLPNNNFYNQMGTDRFGMKDKHGGLDWSQYTKTGLLFERCDELGITGLTGFCQDYSKRNQNNGVVKHTNITLDEASCVNWCMEDNERVTGCEVQNTGSHKGCYRHTQPVGYASGDEGHRCWLSVNHKS